jgi:hypothetical protein
VTTISPVSRRSVLAAALVTPALALSACGSEDRPADDPDAHLKQNTAASERSLIDRYQSAMLIYPELAGELAPIRDQHLQHLAAMGGPTGQITQSAGGLVAPTARDTVAALAKAEGLAAKERLASCDAATSKEFSWHLSLICASESQHAVELSTGH